MSTKEAILKAAHDDPTVLDDDDRLISAVVKLKTGIDIDPSLIKRMPDFQDIKRRRRDLHQYNHIQYSPNTEAERYNNFKKYPKDLAEQRNAVQAPDNFMEEYYA